MKILLLEAPLARINGDESFQIVVGNTPPLHLLRLAQAADAAGCTAEMIPASEDWEALLCGSDDKARLSFIEKMLARDGSVIVFSVSRFNWPLVEAFLESISGATSKPRIVLAAAHRNAIPGHALKSSLADATVSAGYEAGFERLLALWNAGEQNGGAQPTSIEGVSTKGGGDSEDESAKEVRLSAGVERIGDWNRWDNGLSTSETFGFPLDFQPHPWNLPTEPHIECDSMKNWLDRIETPLQMMREAQIWFSTSDPIWNLDFMSTLGEFSLRFIKRDRIAPMFAVRATANQLSAPNVLANMAVLNVTRVDLLVGAGTPAALSGCTDQYTLEQVGECVREMKHVGLAANTRLVFLLGLPDEGMEQAMETVTYASNLAAENSVGELKFEWWLNIPGSSFHRAPAFPVESNGKPTTHWFSGKEALDQAPVLITAEDRRALASTIEFLRSIHLRMTILGPSIL